MKVSDSPFAAILFKMEAVIEVMIGLIRQKHSLILTLSGGKDSTLTTILTLEAIRRARDLGIQQAPHFCSSADTRTDSPAVAQHLEKVHEEVRSYIEREQLDVTIVVAQPSLASTFVVTTLGRGSLPRTPMNSVKDGKSMRPCTIDWKISPQRRAMKKMLAKAAAEGASASCVVLGTRYDESHSRSARMTERNESDVAPVADADGELTISPICWFSTDDVWYALAMFTDEAYHPFPAPITPRSINRMQDIYKAGNDGVCGVTLGNGGQRAPCGTRTGCWNCLQVGNKDKSLSSMVKQPEFAHLAGLNQFRDYMLTSMADMSKRELIGRSLSKAGYIRVQGDVLSYSERLAWLRYLCTLDAIEQDRAERHSNDLANGVIDDSPENQELCDPQFEVVGLDQLIAVDFFLGLHPFCPHAFPALTEWYEIRILGRRYPFPTADNSVQKVNLVRHGWFKVGAFDFQAPTQGLRDFNAELWNKYRHPDRAASYAQTTKGDRICFYEEDEQLSVDPVDACAFVTCSFDAQMHIDAQFHTGMDSSRFWINEGLIKFPKGMAHVYQEMAVRGEYFRNLAERFNLTPKELNEYLAKNSISDAEHDKLLDVENYPLFAALEREPDDIEEAVV